ncbi:MAG: hypothetical protein J6J35_01460 [Alphaproteobacteria bacterium]|nr:hypothetical protein [Alphaproteobacteria bacterium]
MKAYKYDTENHKYLKEVTCQLDPLETIKAGENIWLLPADCTFKEPLPQKEGYFVKFDGNDWIYEEIPQPEPTPELVLTYADLRRAEYPAIPEQLDMIYWDKVKGTNRWEEKISEIKAKYPKVDLND